MRDLRHERLDLKAIRERLKTARGRAYWRSLDEVAETAEFRDYLRHEFPEQADTWTDAVGRRNFLKLMGASFALGGLACARQPLEVIVPYIRQPENQVPGGSRFFATAAPFRGMALGVLAESTMGRPIKIEGNERHPASLGAADAMTQASILSLYDPDRSQAVTRAGLIGTWDAFFNAISLALAEHKVDGGDGLRLLTGTVASPTLAAQIGRLLDAYPKARWHLHEAADRDAVRAGARRAFGRDLEVSYRFDAADVIVTLDADFMSTEPGGLRYIRDFTARRRVRGGERATMNRLYAIESTPTITGAAADHRLALPPGRIADLARDLAVALGVPAAGGRKGSGRAAAGATEGGAAVGRFIAAAAADLRAHHGHGLVLAGDQQPAGVHALAHAINHALGNLGGAVVLTDPVEARPRHGDDSLRALADDMQAGAVKTLIMLGGNPAYDAPADLDFATRMARVGLRIHLSGWQDETSDLCHWHLPETHYLEAWGDLRAFDGTVTLQQPLIAPLYDGRSAIEVMALLLGEGGRGGHDLVRDHWKTARDGDGVGFDAFWSAALHDGTVPGTVLPPRQAAPVLAAGALRHPAAASGEGGAAAGEGGLASGGAQGAPDGDLEIIFRPDPSIWDGRHANNGWLQELPKPLTKLTWDNAALLGPREAEKRGLRDGDVVELAYRGRALEAPVFIVPGHADGCVTLHLGFGRTRAGRVGNGAGVNAYALRTSDAPGFGAGLRLRRIGAGALLATTQQHQSMEGRHLVRAATLGEYEADPHFAPHQGHEPGADLTLHQPHTSDGPAWGMAIDLNACVGCNACVVACQSENNSPVVGKDQVSRGREMHWMRIDRYFEGGLDDPEVHHQPVLCMHCENAPCEPVCPVGATTHSTDGHNQMVYNRCVGTRYCSNNCPYKVRRFNFLAYSDLETPSRQLGYNPNVTVRTRGVMEKCTYCVQRISEARITAEKESRPIRDGEVVTACQASCPAEAIVFGDTHDPKSRVARLKSDPRSYGILTELNTRPRTTYLARLRNPNPALAPREE